MRRRAGSFVLLLALAACSSEGEERESVPPETGAATTETTTEGPAQTETAEPGPLRLRLEPLADGLGALTHVTHAPGEPESLYLVRRDGQILVWRRGRVQMRPFLDIGDLVTSGGEQGLLSVAFHPDFAAEGRFYVNYTDTSGDTRVVEYRKTQSGLARRQLLRLDQPYANHNGGQLAFGLDGFLYAGMGDGGSGGDPENRAQNLDSQLGKLLRMDVDDEDAGWQTVAYGLRNPWRFSFDRETGDLWLGDVGQGAIEEIDYLPRGRTALVNFGWDVFEGTRRFEDKKPNPRGELVEPVAEYGHDLGCSVTGGFVYRGGAIPAARGRYFYGDYCSGIVWSLRLEDGRATNVRRHEFTVEGLSSFGEDASGELYLVSLNGELYRLAAR